MTVLSDVAYVAAQYPDTTSFDACMRFAAVRVERRQSALEIRAAAPLVAYVRSMQSAATPASDSNLARLAAHVEREIARSGSLHVGLAAGRVTGVRR